jgi:hypothetical protein
MRYFLLLFTLLHFAGLQGQDDTFPAAWQGIWQGDLVISTAQGEQQRVPMELHIMPVADSTYTFSIIYGEPSPENTRPYLLYPQDRTQGHYVVDEQNEILLDDFLINGKLYSRFEVMGSLLLTTLEKQGDHLIYEIIAGPLEPFRTTGDAMVDGEEIPPVNGYKINVQQRAELSLKED